MGTADCEDRLQLKKEAHVLGAAHNKCAVSVGNEHPVNRRVYLIKAVSEDLGGPLQPGNSNGLFGQGSLFPSSDLDHCVFC